MKYCKGLYRWQIDIINFRITSCPVASHFSTKKHKTYIYIYIYRKHNLSNKNTIPMLNVYNINLKQTIQPENCLQLTFSGGCIKSS